MITICNGWTNPQHQTIVLKDDRIADAKVSHGMCGACQRAMGVAMNTMEAATFKANRQSHAVADIALAVEAALAEGRV